MEAIQKSTSRLLQEERRETITQHSSAERPASHLLQGSRPRDGAGGTQSGVGEARGWSVNPPGGKVWGSGSAGYSVNTLSAARPRQRAQVLPSPGRAEEPRPRAGCSVSQKLAPERARPQLGLMEGKPKARPCQTRLRLGWEGQL